MVNVKFVDPGYAVPESASENAYYFHPSTRTGFLRQIESLARQKDRRLFVATEQDRLVAVGLTKVRQVLSIDGDEVLLSGSHARHRVNPGVRLLSVGDWYELAIDPASNDILEGFKVTPRVAEKPPISSYPVDPYNLPSVSQSEAEAFFSSVRRQPHIPFQYPSNGCWVRAHEMCRLIERYFDNDPRVVVAKIWNFGKLTVKTDNNPDCLVKWLYHVAPVVKVGEELLVIDPSLFERPMSVDAWRRRQSDLSREPIFTSLRAYEFVINTNSFVEESSGKTQKQLQDFWGDFVSLVFTHGPIPYRCGAK